MAAIPRMLTIQQAADETGISYSCLYKWCKTDQIIYRKVGKKYLINMNKLIDYLNGEETGGGEA